MGKGKAFRLLRRSFPSRAEAHFKCLSKKLSTASCARGGHSCFMSHISVVRFLSAPWLFHTSCIMSNAFFTPGNGDDPDADDGDAAEDDKL